MDDELTDALAGIQLTKEGRIPQRDYDLVTDDDIAEVLADPARAAIICILRHGIEDKKTVERKDDASGERVIREKIVKRHSLSVTEISQLSQEPGLCDTPLTNSQIYHHLPKLIKAGYVIKFGTTTKGKRNTDYYRRTAKIFMFDKLPGVKDGGEEYGKSKEKIKKMLSFFGFDLSEELLEEYVELRIQASAIEHEGHSKLMRMVRTDVADKDVLYMFEDFICSFSIASDEWVKIRKRMNEILFD